MTNVFIASKIKVGFQKRTDTFTGQLAYIIYYDAKGKIRKEQSWNTWRDHKIDPQEFENAPMDGFTLNKDVKRYSGEWFSSHRTMIRVHDPRGFEFEVTTENLIGILMHTDCLKRGLIGQFVYAWVGPELVLLPTNSEEYQNATKFTAGLSKSVKSKELVPGISYKTKREGDVVFMGKLNWYEYDGKNRCYALGIRKESKALVFTADDGKKFFKKPSPEFLSMANSDTPVSNFAELVDKFNKKAYANKIVRYDFRATSFNPYTKETTYYGPELRRTNYFVESKRMPGVFVNSAIQAVKDHKYDIATKKSIYTLTGYSFDDSYSYGSYGLKQSDGEIVEIPTDTNRSSYDYSYHSRNNSVLDLSKMQEQKLYDLYVVFENGKEKRITSVYEFTSES